MDERLRELERRAASGDPEAEAGFLRRRLAAGELSERQVRLAAYLGHPAALRIYELRLRPQRQELMKWVRGLRHHGGDEAWLRASLAAARVALATWRDAAPREERPARALAACDRLLACPCPEHLEAIRGAVLAVGAVFPELMVYRRRADDLEALRRERFAVSAQACQRVAEEALRQAQGARPSTYFSGLSVAAGVVPEDVLRHAIQAELTPWALSAPTSVRLPVVDERA